MWLQGQGMSCAGSCCPPASLSWSFGAGAGAGGCGSRERRRLHVQPPLGHPEPLCSLPPHRLLFFLPPSPHSLTCHSSPLPLLPVGGGWESGRGAGREVSEATGLGKLPASQKRVTGPSCSQGGQRGGPGEPGGSGALRSRGDGGHAPRPPHWPAARGLHLVDLIGSTWWVRE